MADKILKLQEKLERIQRTENVLAELNALKALVSCPKCKHIYIDPMHFKCSHVVCRKCIEGFGSYITCPLCIQKTSQHECRNAVELQPTIDFVLSVQNMYINKFKHSKNTQLRTIINFNNVPNRLDLIAKMHQNDAPNFEKLHGLKTQDGTQASTSSAPLNTNPRTNDEEEALKENKPKTPATKRKRAAKKTKKGKRTQKTAVVDTQIAEENQATETNAQQTIIEEIAEPFHAQDTGAKEPPLNITSTQPQASDNVSTDTVENLVLRTLSIPQNFNQVSADTVMRDLQEAGPSGTSQNACKESSNEDCEPTLDRIDLSPSNLQCMEAQLEKFILLYYNIEKQLEERSSEINKKTRMRRIIHRCMKKMMPKIETIQEIISGDDDDDLIPSANKCVQTEGSQQSMSVQTDPATPKKKSSQPGVFSSSFNLDGFDTQTAIKAALESIKPVVSDRPEQVQTNEPVLSNNPEQVEQNTLASSNEPEEVAVSQVMRNVDTMTQTAMEIDNLQVVEKPSDVTVFQPTIRRKRVSKRLLSDRKTNTQISKKSNVISLDEIETELGNLSQKLSAKLRPVLSVNFDSETQMEVANDTIYSTSELKDVPSNQAEHSENDIEEPIASQASVPKSTQDKVQIISNICIAKPQEIPDDVDIIEASDEEGENNITISHDIFTPVRTTLNPLCRATANISPILPAPNRGASGLLLQKHTPCCSKRPAFSESTPFRFATSAKKAIVMVSRLSTEDHNMVKLLASRNIAKYKADLDAHATHLVVETDASNRVANLTAKYIRSVAASLWIVNVSWVHACLTQNKLVPEEDYEVRDIDGEDGPRKSRISGINDKLFKSFIFFLMEIKDWNKDHIRDMILKQGGTIANNLRMIESSPLTGMVISQPKACKENEDDTHDGILQRFKVISVDIEWLTKSIRYCSIVGVSPYLLCDPDDTDDLDHYPDTIWNSRFDGTGEASVIFE